MWSFGLCDL